MKHRKVQLVRPQSRFDITPTVIWAPPMTGHLLLLSPSITVLPSSFAFLRSCYVNMKCVCELRTVVAAQPPAAS